MSSDSEDFVNDIIKLTDTKQDCNQMTAGNCQNTPEDKSISRTSQDITLLHKCIPVTVDIVDCRKFPWYHKKKQESVCSSQLVDGEDDDDIIILVDDHDHCIPRVSETACEGSTAGSEPDKAAPERELNKSYFNKDSGLKPALNEIKKLSSELEKSDLTPIANTIGISEEMSVTKLKIRPVDIASYNIKLKKPKAHQSKQLNPRIVHTNHVIKAVDNSKKANSPTISRIDFKRNIGLIGLKIVDKTKTLLNPQLWDTDKKKNVNTSLPEKNEILKEIAEKTYLSMNKNTSKPTEKKEKKRKAKKEDLLFKPNTTINAEFVNIQDKEDQKTERECESDNNDQTLCRNLSDKIQRVLSANSNTTIPSDAEGEIKHHSTTVKISQKKEKKRLKVRECKTNKTDFEVKKKEVSTSSTVIRISKKKSLTHALFNDLYLSSDEENDFKLSRKWKESKGHDKKEKVETTNKRKQKEKTEGYKNKIRFTGKRSNILFEFEKTYKKVSDVMNLEKNGEEKNKENLRTNGSDLMHSNIVRKASKNAVVPDKCSTENGMTACNLQLNQAQVNNSAIKDRKNDAQEVIASKTGNNMTANCTNTMNADGIEVSCKHHDNIENPECILNSVGFSEEMPIQAHIVIKYADIPEQSDQPQQVITVSQQGSPRSLGNTKIPVYTVSTSPVTSNATHFASRNEKITRYPKSKENQEITTKLIQQRPLETKRQSTPDSSPGIKRHESDNIRNKNHRNTTLFNSDITLNNSLESAHAINLSPPKNSHDSMIPIPTCEPYVFIGSQVSAETNSDTSSNLIPRTDYDLNSFLVNDDARNKIFKSNPITPLSMPVLTDGDKYDSRTLTQGNNDAVYRTVQNKVIQKTKTPKASKVNMNVTSKQNCILSNEGQQHKNDPKKNDTVKCGQKKRKINRTQDQIDINILKNNNNKNTSIKQQMYFHNGDIATSLKQQIYFQNGDIANNIQQNSNKTGGVCNYQLQNNISEHTTISFNNQQPDLNNRCMPNILQCRHYQMQDTNGDFNSMQQVKNSMSLQSGRQTQAYGGYPTQSYDTMKQGSEIPQNPALHNSFTSSISLPPYAITSMTQNTPMPQNSQLSYIVPSHLPLSPKASIASHEPMAMSYSATTPVFSNFQKAASSHRPMHLPSNEQTHMQSNLTVPFSSHPTMPMLSNVMPSQLACNVPFQLPLSPKAPISSHASIAMPFSTIPVSSNVQTAASLHRPMHMPLNEPIHMQSNTTVTFSSDLTMPVLSNVLPSREPMKMPPWPTHGVPPNMTMAVSSIATTHVSSNSLSYSSMQMLPNRPMKMPQNMTSATQSNATMPVSSGTLLTGTMARSKHMVAQMTTVLSNIQKSLSSNLATPVSSNLQTCTSTSRYMDGNMYNSQMPSEPGWCRTPETYPVHCERLYDKQSRRLLSGASQHYKGTFMRTSMWATQRPGWNTNITNLQTPSPRPVLPSLSLQPSPSTLMHQPSNMAPAKPITSAIPSQVASQNIIGRNSDGFVRKIVIAKQPQSSQNPSGPINSQVASTTIENPSSSSIILSKSQMLEELSNITDSEDLYVTSPKNPSTRHTEVSNEDRIPTEISPKKNTTLSSPPMFTTRKKGYSAPILPIPSHEKTIELLCQSQSQSKLMTITEETANDLPPMQKEILFIPQNETTKRTNTSYAPNLMPTDNINNTSPNKRKLSNEEFERNNKPVKKISLNEYKKRVSISDEPNMKFEIKSEFETHIPNEIRQSTESDLGYDSDSTVKL